MPVFGEHVLEWFWELSAARGSNGFGALPITYGEIAAWQALTGVEPEAWEVKAIREMDMAFLAAFSKLKV